MTPLPVDADHITITETHCPNAKACLNAADWHGVRGGPEPVCECEPRQSIVLSRSAVIVMDGEHVDEYGQVWGSKLAEALGNVIVGTQPPEQVRRLTEPCQTCRGTGQEYVNAELASFKDPGCQDCRNGKPTFTLSEQCHHPETAKRIGASPMRHCLDCEDGVIDLGDGWVITDVLPIVDVHHQRTEQRVVKIIGGQGYICQSETRTKCDLPSAAAPGQYAVFAEQVAS